LTVRPIHQIVFFSVFPTFNAATNQRAILPRLWQGFEIRAPGRVSPAFRHVL
jgi:hypothetical protein